MAENWRWWLKNNMNSQTITHENKSNNVTLCKFYRIYHNISHQYTEYIPQNIHMVVLYLIVLRLYYQFAVNSCNVFTLIFQGCSTGVASNDCPSTSEVTLNGKSKINYCKISNIRRTKSQNLYVSRLGLQLSLPNILKPNVKWRMKM